MLTTGILLIYSGHGSVVDTPNGEDWFMYHAWRWHQVDQEPLERVLCLDKIHWNAVDDGWPYIGVPSDRPTLVPNTISSLTFF